MQYLVPRAYAIRDEALQLNQPVKLSIAGVAEAGGLVVLDNTLEIVFFVTRAADVNLMATVHCTSCCVVRVTRKHSLRPNQTIALCCHHIRGDSGDIATGGLARIEQCQ